MSINNNSKRKRACGKRKAAVVYQGSPPFNTDCTLQFNNLSKVVITKLFHGTIFQATIYKIYNYTITVDIKLRNISKQSIKLTTNFTTYNHR